jgi:hypothetical protein
MLRGVPEGDMTVLRGKGLPPPVGCISGFSGHFKEEQERI